MSEQLVQQVHRSLLCPPPPCSLQEHAWCAARPARAKDKALRCPRRDRRRPPGHACGEGSPLPHRRARAQAMRPLPPLQRRCRPYRSGQGLQGHSGFARSVPGGEWSAESHTGRWPVKSAKYLQRLIVNAKSNAAVNELDVEDLFIKSIIVNQAPKTRRRTYRAHGRINPYQVRRLRTPLPMHD
jgi:ribosomal protein L22